MKSISESLLSPQHSEWTRDGHTEQETMETKRVDATASQNGMPLQPTLPEAIFHFGDTTLEFQLDPVTQRVGMRLYPTAFRDKIVARRKWLVDFEHQREGTGEPKLRAAQVDSLVQVKCVGDDYPTGFSQGSSLRNSATTLGLAYEKQRVTREGDQTTITIFLRDAKNRAAEHRIVWHERVAVLEVDTLFRNDSSETVSLELLSSFSLGDITPFHSSDAPNRLRVHRLRAGWSAEGRLDTQTIEELNLERSWQEHAVRCERFGQVGSLPVKGFFPFAAVEDTEAGVCWGAQLAWAGSWQMEFYRQSDALCLSGGLADREFGHWMKNLEPGQSFTTPVATLACVAGDLDALCQRLTRAQDRAAELHPEVEAELPIICNEFCTSWGNPTHDNIEAIAKRLQGTPVKYLVIDAGWYGSPGEAWWMEQGTWQPDKSRFPQGLAATAQMIRDYGLIPGLWFEAEVAGSGSPSFHATEHQLKRDGIAVTTTNRHFWDLRDPWVHQYLEDRVIRLLKDCGFGYAKFDYNETIGIGVDGAESLGEGLRQHIEGVTRFFDRIRTELPDLVIESCSSGGHRLEPSMIARSAMSSFSDAHESLEIPIIAANTHKVMLPRQSQIWAVLRRQDDTRRLIYSLAATFLGRMCISGDLPDLNLEQWDLVERAMNFYRRVAPIIRRGNSRRFGTDVRSYRYPTGWQALRRVSECGNLAMVVIHSFENLTDPVIQVPLPDSSRWQVVEVLGNQGTSIVIKDESIHIALIGSFDAVVLLLEKDSPVS